MFPDNFSLTDALLDFLRLLRRYPGRGSLRYADREFAGLADSYRRR